MTDKVVLFSFVINTGTDKIKHGEADIQWQQAGAQVSRAPLAISRLAGCTGCGQDRGEQPGDTGTEDPGEGAPDRGGQDTGAG